MHRAEVVQQAALEVARQMIPSLWLLMLIALMAITGIDLSTRSMREALVTS